MRWSFRPGRYPAYSPPSCGLYVFRGIGVINDLLIRANLITERISFVSSHGMAMAAVIIATIWRGIPFFAISFLSSLQTIPGDVYEAAQVDGAGAIRRFLYITLPMIKDSIVLTTLLRTIWTLNAADVIFSLTGAAQPTPP